MVTEAGAHIGLVVGGVILGCATIGTVCSKAGEAVLVTETLSNSDGDPSPSGEIKALSDVTSQLINRPLTQSDLGLEGKLETLKGTFSVKDGIATVTIDMIEGNITNPFKAFENLINLAKSSGANTLMIQANIANERLYKVLLNRYGFETQGGVDYIIIPLIEKLTQQ